METDGSNRKRSKIALNKSASFSGSPVTQKYEIKQLFRSKDGDTYIRQCSYEISGKRKYQQHRFSKPSSPKSKPIKQTEYCYTPYEGGLNPKGKSNVKFGIPFNYLFTFAKHIAEEKGFTNTLNENVPMEIDKSMTDVHQNDDKNANISTSHQNKVPKLVLKPTKSIEVIKSNETKVKKMGNASEKVNTGYSFLVRLVKVFLFLFIPVLIGTLSMYLQSNSSLVETFDSKAIMHNLKSNLYGQEKIINLLEYNLNLIKNNKVFIFTGGTGVGKTYAAKIIEKNFPWPNNVQKIYPSSKEYYRNLEKRITNNIEKNSQNLIIIDSLSVDDIYFILPIINNLSYIQTKFIIILIFNIPNETLQPLPAAILNLKSNGISKIFTDNNVSHTLFVFENLSEIDTRECIKSTLLQKNMKIDEENVENILESINYRFSGCKGVYQKVSLLEASRKNVIRNDNL